MTEDTDPTSGSGQQIRSSLSTKSPPSSCVPASWASMAR
jgi:hypothetical protein